MGELKSTFKEMLDRSVEFAQTDEGYQVDMEKIKIFKINWDVCGLKGYQVFEKNKCTYKIGELVEDPDVLLTIDNEERAIPFLKGESVNYGMRYSGKGTYVMVYTVGWKEFVHPEKGWNMRDRDLATFITAQFYKTRGKFTPMMFGKFPMFKKFRIGMDKPDKNQWGSYIPINKSLGAFESQVLPLKLFKHFIDKASHIVVRDCGCREEFHHVSEHDDDISLGCMYMGDDVLQIIDPVPLNGVRVVTKEEALDHLQRALNNGLIPILGRAVGELNGFGKDDTGHCLSCCFCCTCCCINGKMMSSAPETRVPRTGGFFGGRFEGLLMEVDQEKCIGCEKCMDVCVFKGMEMIEDKAHIRDNYCLGCGRCADICPEEAILIEVDDESRLNELIKKVEKYVDVEPQSEATVKD